MKDEKLLNINQASKILGVAQSTLRRWENEGRLIPDSRTKGGQRRYKLSTLRPEMKHKIDYNRKTIAYARVSSNDQKADLERQKQLLELYCASRSKKNKKLLEDLQKVVNVSTQN